MSNSQLALAADRQASRMASLQQHAYVILLLQYDGQLEEGDQDGDLELKEGHHDEQHD